LTQFNLNLNLNESSLLYQLIIMAPVSDMPGGIDDDMRDSSFIVSSQPDDSGDERRFVWVQKLLQDGAAKSGASGKPATSQSTPHETIRGKSGFSKHGKHQVNYSATKYIKP
jgi:hypothetical protein